MKYLFSILALSLFTRAFAQDINVHFKIYDVKKQKTISLNEIVDDVAKSDVLFFGEEHNDSIGHYLEAEIFKTLHEKFNAKVALSMEMFHTDVQVVIDEYLADVISEKNFIKDGRAWSNYNDYKPLIEYGKKNKLSIIAANAASRYSNSVTKNGLTILDSFPKSSASFFPPLPIDTATGRYYQKFNDLLGGHSMGTMKVYQTQNFWDATMAWSIAKYLRANKGHKVFQVNGRFHSDEKLGTVSQLLHYVPKVKVLNISAFSDDSFEDPDWNKFMTLGDYIIITDPKVKRSY